MLFWNTAENSRSFLIVQPSRNLEDCTLTWSTLFCQGMAFTKQNLKLNNLILRENNFNGKENIKSTSPICYHNFIKKNNFNEKEEH